MNASSRWLSRLRRMMTVGHAIALVVMVLFVYQAWGRIFSPGGTGSNVVLGLLIAIAALYLGVTNLGPLLDGLVLPKEKRRAARLAKDVETTIHELDDLLKSAAKGKVKPPLDARQVDNLQQRNDAARQALAAVEGPRLAKATPAQIAHLEAMQVELDTAIQAELKSRKVDMLGQAKSLGIAFAVAIALRLFLIAPFQIPSGSMIPTLLIGDHIFVFRAQYGLQSPLGDTPSYLARWALPKPGDVVVFEAPPWVQRNAGEDWIKRVIAGPGQRVKRVGQTIIVDDQPYTRPGEGTMTRYMDYEDLPGGRGRWHESVALHHVEDVAGVEHDVFQDMPPMTGDWPNASEPRMEQEGLRCTPTECTVEDGFVFVMGDNRDHSSDGRVWGAVPVDNVKGKAMFIWVSVDGSEEAVSLGKFTLPRFRWGRMFDWIR